MPGPYFTFSNPVRPGTRIASEKYNSDMGALDAGLSLLPEPDKLFLSMLGFAEATFISNAYSITISTGAPLLSYIDGMQVTFKAANTSTSTATLNVNGLGPVVMIAPGGSPLPAGAIQAGSYYTVRYDGMYFQMQTAVYALFSTQVQQAIDAANASSASASASAASATAAANSATSAAGSASTATNRATAASASATEALASQNAAAASASSAQTSAGAASTSASASQSYRDQASASATSAANSATAAANSATSAANSATAAANSASTATTQANRAQSEADRAAASGASLAQVDAHLTGYGYVGQTTPVVTNLNSILNNAACQFSFSGMATGAPVSGTNFFGVGMQIPRGQVGAVTQKVVLATGDEYSRVGVLNVWDPWVKTGFNENDLTGTAWTPLTLQNGWVAQSGSRAVYRKVLGLVFLELYVSGGTITDATTIFTLPTGFRPATQIVAGAWGIGTGSTTQSVAPRFVIGSGGVASVYNVRSNTELSLILCFSTQ